MSEASLGSEGCCPACGGRDLEVFFEVPRVPVNSVLLLPTREEALAFPTGKIELAYCHGCSFIFNKAFDPSKLEYSDRYEETQGYSKTFQEWHENLARRVIERFNLRNKLIVEIGCGKGEFLTRLCELGPNRGIGYDPSYRPERNQSEAVERIEFVRDFYPEDSAPGGDLVICKMTLEHIAPVYEFVASVRRSLEGKSETDVFFQIPSAERILQDCAFWDIYYEHCSYFGVPSLSRVFRRAGFQVVSVSRDYGGQYLMIEARPALTTIAETPEQSQISQLVRSFRERVTATLDGWRRRLDEFKAEGKRVVLWGGGSKGVAFLTTLALGDEVIAAVDINPNKHGHFMAMTGHPIVGPDELKEIRPDVVVVMNELYTDEIKRDLAARDLYPEVIPL